jgi:CRISPR-associated protein Csb1
MSDTDKSQLSAGPFGIDNIGRLFVEAVLKVEGFGGGRFQPTNFPDLGPALYRGADGKQWLLVESPQSMANRMEKVCWLDGGDSTDRVGRYNDDCRGIPFVLAVDSDNRPLTASPLEAHRLASPYISDSPVQNEGADKGKSLLDVLKTRFELKENRIVPWKKVAAALVKIDPGCLLHGIWFNDSALAGGKVRLTRVLSGYIEASEPAPANYGFQKRDDVLWATDKEAGQSASEGFGSVIGPKQHFTSRTVKACFQIDLDRLRNYGLPSEDVRALAAWAIYKVRRVLVDGQAGVGGLRTECKFACESVSSSYLDAKTGKEVKGFALPELGVALSDAFKSLRVLKPDGLPDESDGITKVRWIPKIEGKVELPKDFDRALIILTSIVVDKAEVATITPKATKKKPNPEPKTYLVIKGEWTAEDKRKLRELNPTGDSGSNEAKRAKLVEDAISAYEEQWTAKAQGSKADDDDAEEPSE